MEFMVENFRRFRRSIVRNTTRSRLRDKALSQEEAQNKPCVCLAPLQSQTAKAFVLRRRCDPARL